MYIRIVRRVPGKRPKGAAGTRGSKPKRGPDVESRVKGEGFPVAHPKGVAGAEVPKRRKPEPVNRWAVVGKFNSWKDPRVAPVGAGFSAQASRGSVKAVVKFRTSLRNFGIDSPGPLGPGLFYFRINFPPVPLFQRGKKKDFGARPPIRSGTFKPLISA